MIASLRGVIALAVVALVLAVVAFAGGGEPAKVDRAVLPSLPTAPTQLAWTRPRGPDMTVERSIGGAWTMLKPAGVCDARAVEAVLATLRGARWHRRGDRDQAGAIHATLTFTGHVIELGDPIHGADQAWIVVDGAAMLVDGWVARSLDPDPLALRVRTPLGTARASDKIAVVRPGHEPVQLHGRPWRDPHGVLAAEVIEPVLHAIESLEIVRVPDGPIAVPDTTSIEIAGAKVVVGGRCPGDPHLIALASSAGDGCLDPAVWHDVEVAMARLDGPTEDVIDHRPAAGVIAKITLRDGVIDLDKRAHVVIAGVPHPADPDRVAELVRELAAPAKLVPVPAVASNGQIRVDFRDGGSVELIQYGALLVRPGEVLAMQLDGALHDRPIAAYLDPTRWLEDPTTVASLEIDGTRTTRGVVLGEWSRGGIALPPRDAALVGALAEAIAQVRAPLAQVPDTWRPAQTIRVTFEPPVGPPSTHTVELGPPQPDGCLARFDHAPGLAPLALCTAARSLLVHP